MTLSVIDGGNAEGRQAPNAYEAEREVLAVCLVWPQEHMQRVVDALPPEQLYNRALRVVWEAMRALWADRQALDPLLVTQWLKDHGRFEVAGGMKTIGSLMERAGLLGDLSHYLDVIAEKWRKRRLLAAAAAIERLGWDDGVSAEEAMTSVDAQYRALIRDTASADLHGDSSEAIAAEILAMVDGAEAAVTAGQSVGMSMGFKPLTDALGGGPWPGELGTIQGYTANGKSELAGQVIADCVRSGGAALVYSLEMPRRQYMGRLAGNLCGVSVAAQRSGKLTHDQRSRLTEALDTLTMTNLGVVTASGWHIGKIQSHARQWVRDRGAVSLIVLDHLYLAGRPPEAHNTTEALDLTSRGMKNLVTELDCVGLQLAQPTQDAARGGQERTVRRPRMSDVKGSGSIKDDSDFFVTVYRPDMDDSRVEFAIDKWREDDGAGKSKVIQARFNARRRRFEDEPW